MVEHALTGCSRERSVQCSSCGDDAATYNRRVQKQLTYELADDARSIIVDFDDNPDARYAVDIRPDADDEVVITANPEACRAFARLFAQLAERGGHVHLGLSHVVPQGPGLRITVSESGSRSDD